MDIVNDAVAANADQAECWNSAVGRKWIDHERALDQTLSGVLRSLIENARLQAGDRALDIGCGTGASSLAAATVVGPGRVTGIDISQQMLERARQRAQAAGVENADFLLADAQTHRFDMPAHDALISRFGMMFFDDPSAALGNLAQALRPGARMTFAAWAAADRNPWFGIPQRAAINRLGPVPPTDPDAPGPFAFQNAGRVTEMLRAVGLSEVRGDEVELMLTPSGDVTAAATLAVRVGPAVRIMQAKHGTPEDEQAIAARIAADFRDYESGGAVQIPAAIIFYSARR